MRLEVRGLRSELAGPFDFELDQGRCAAISGASGSGKSLFLRMIADLDPNQGEALLDGVSRDSLTGPQWRRKVTYVAAEPGWWLERAVDHVASADIATAREVAARFGVGPTQLDGPVSRLSTGERQRLSLVRTLVLAAPVLLLDEPTGPLDPETTRAVEAYLRERMTAGTAIVMVSHNPDQAGRMGADRYRMVQRRLERLA